MSDELKPCRLCSVGQGIENTYDSMVECYDCGHSEVGIEEWNMDRYITTEDLPEMVRKTIAAKALRDFANKYAIALEADDYDSGYNQALNQADFEAVLLEKEI